MPLAGSPSRSPYITPDFAFMPSKTTDPAPKRRVRFADDVEVRRLRRVSFPGVATAHNEPDSLPNSSNTSPSASIIMHQDFPYTNQRVRRYSDDGPPQYSSRGGKVRDSLQTNTLNNSHYQRLSTHLYESLAPPPPPPPPPPAPVAADPQAQHNSSPHLAPPYGSPPEMRRARRNSFDVPSTPHKVVHDLNAFHSFHMPLPFPSFHTPTFVGPVLHPVLDAYHQHREERFRFPLSSSTFMPMQVVSRASGSYEARLDKAELNLPATYPPIFRVRIVHEDLAHWPLLVRNVHGGVLSVGDTLRAVHRWLHTPITPLEWQTLIQEHGEEAKLRVATAFHRRCRGSRDVAEKLKGVKRIDYLGAWEVRKKRDVHFGGFIKENTGIRGRGEVWSLLVS